jgi:hypothetical protein
LLERCLTSCFRQTHPNIEIILVDNNSTDGSVFRAQRLADGQAHKLKVAHCPTQGQAFTRNLGFELAEGRYLQWLDADDELSPEKIARQVAALEINPDRDIAYCDWEWRFLENRKVTQTLYFPARQQDDYLLCLLADYWSAPHVYLLRRAAAERLRALGHWQTKTRIMADRQYFASAAVIGCRFLYVAGCAARYNSWSSQQLTKSTPLPVRAASGAEIYARLRGQADKEPAARFTPEHRWLLDQSWKIYRLAAAQDVSGPGRPRHVRNTETGREIELDAAEMTVLAACARSPQATILEYHAASAALDLWLDVARSARREGRSRLDALRRLREILAMPPEIEPEDEQDAARLPIRPIPLAAPILMKERLAIRHALARLIDKGLLLAVEAGDEGRG